MRKLFFISAIALSGFAATAQTNWPTVTNVTKPWTRWWWEGSAVNKSDLAWNLEQYKKAGLGGTELTPIYGIKGFEKQFISFLSPQWMEMLQFTLEESKRLGLGVDMANGTGWPFGGPWVHEDNASKTVVVKNYTVKEGAPLSEKVMHYQQPLIRSANPTPIAYEDVKKPVWSNPNLQALAIDQVKYSGALPLQCLMAYNKDGVAIDLTSKVDTAGNLSWTAPAGEWTLYALFEALHGKMVERAAPGGEGYAIDHFSAKAANDYFAMFDEAFKGYDLSYMRGFFNDSYEVDDARGQSNWTSDLFEQFTKRKGYDLKTQLPALFGKADAETNRRVLYDYRSVIDELILENFTEQWKHWAEGKNKIVRNQSHGSPANTLDLYGVVDIPETEGNDILRFKFATSAANVMGKKLVSSESATWLNEHFLSSWGDVKKAIDLFFLGGVNHVFYHGAAYTPKEAPWPGWLFYAAVHFQPSNPQWKDFHVLNEYITRTQSFLQQGKAANDVLLYYPIADRYSETTGEVLLQHFDGMEKNFEHTDFEQVSKWMLNNGYSFDFFSDRQLMQFTVKDKQVISHGSSYKVILLPANKLIPEASMKQLVQLAKEGASILFYKYLPTSVPGFYQLNERKKAFDEMVASVKFASANGGIEAAAMTNGGSIKLSASMEALMKASGVKPEMMNAKGLQSVKRMMGDTAVYFITNTGTQAFDGWVPFNDKYTSVLLFDAMNGSVGMASINSDVVTNVMLQLQPGESIIVKAMKKPVKAIAFSYKLPVATPITLVGNWKVEFLDGGPVLATATSAASLTSWTDWGTDELKNFSGSAKYSLSFDRPAAKATRYLLDLGTVHETAEIILNGKPLSTLIGPSFQTWIPASLLKQRNTIEIIVSNLMANRIAYMDRNNMPWKIFYNTNMPARKKENVKDGLFNASAWKPLPSGLIGPVTITPCK